MKNNPLFDAAIKKADPEVREEVRDVIDKLLDEWLKDRDGCFWDGVNEGQATNKQRKTSSPSSSPDSPRSSAMHSPSPHYGRNFKN